MDTGDTKIGGETARACSRYHEENSRLLLLAGLTRVEEEWMAWSLPPFYHPTTGRESVPSIRGVRGNREVSRDLVMIASPSPPPFHPAPAKLYTSEMEEEGLIEPGGRYTALFSISR